MLIPLLSAVLAACAPAAAPSVAPTGSPAIATPIVTIEPTARTEPTPEPIPADLLGKWQAEFAEGDVAVLELKEHAFSIVRFGSANGRLELDDGALLFSHSSLCAGEGRYAWTLDGDTLQLESIGTDACEGREKSLDGATYVRLD
jgi:hypothetical protein